MTWPLGVPTVLESNLWRIKPRKSIWSHRSTFRSLNINGGGNGLVTKLCIHSCDSLNYSPPGYSKPSSTGYSKPSSNCYFSSVHGIICKEYWVELSYPSSEDFS